MRRYLAILLMLLLPLQVTWAAVASMHGHLDADESVALFHHHDDDHDHAAHHDEDETVADVASADHHDDDHRDGHFHPAFTMFVVEPVVSIASPLPDVHSPGPGLSFTSHIPLPSDRPPLALR